MRAHSLSHTHTHFSLSCLSVACSIGAGELGWGWGFLVGVDPLFTHRDCHGPPFGVAETNIQRKAVPALPGLGLDTHMESRGEPLHFVMGYPYCDSIDPNQKSVPIGYTGEMD